MTPSATVRRVARKPRVTGWLAWSLCAAVVVCQLLALVLEFSARTVELSPEWGTWRSRAFGNLGLSGAAVLGAVMASRLPRNPYGWLWLAFGVVVGGVRSVAAAYGLHGAVAEPGSLPAAAPVAFVADLAWALGIGILPFLFLCYPDGRLPSARWRPIAGITIAAWALALLSAVGLDGRGQVPIANPYQLAGRGAVIAAAVGEGGLAVVFAMVFVGAGSLLVRFRRASDVERAQLKWLLFAAAVYSARFVVDLVTPALPGVANQVLNTLIFAGACGLAPYCHFFPVTDRCLPVWSAARAHAVRSPQIGDSSGAASQTMQ